MSDYKAYLVIRELGTDAEVHRVGVSSLDTRSVECVMLGMLRKMRDGLYIDDSEVDAAREKDDA